MSYYLLQKNNTIIHIEPIYFMEYFVIPKLYKPYISHSLYFYYYTLQLYLCNHSAYQDRKDNPTNSILYLYDLYKIFFIPETFYHINGKYLHISQTEDIACECIKMFTPDISYNITYFNNINQCTFHLTNKTKFDMIYLETDETILTTYITTFIKCLMIVLRYQNNKGGSIIKISHLFYKPIIEVLYIFTSLYENVYIIKPTTNTSFEKYIYCKKFIHNVNQENLNNIHYYKLSILLNQIGNKQIIEGGVRQIKSILKYEIPYYFKTKINEINVIFGQSQLDAMTSYVI